MTGLEKSVAALDAHIASMPVETRRALYTIARASVPLVTAHAAALQPLLGWSTASRLLDVIKSAFFSFSGAARNVDKIGEAARTYAPTLMQLCAAVAAPTDDDATPTVYPA